MSDVSVWVWGVSLLLALLAWGWLDGMSLSSRGGMVK